MLALPSTKVENLRWRGGGAGVSAAALAVLRCPWGCCPPARSPAGVSDSRWTLRTVLAAAMAGTDRRTLNRMLVFKLLLAVSSLCDARSTPVSQPLLGGLMHRPTYHLIPQGSEAGWISDPNGPIFFKGRYHVFYQAATSAQMRSHCTPSSCSFHTPDPVSW